MSCVRFQISPLDARRRWLQAHVSFLSALLLGACGGGSTSEPAGLPGGAANAAASPNSASPAGAPPAAVGTTAIGATPATAADSAASSAPAAGVTTTDAAVPVTALAQSATVPPLDISSRAASLAAYQRHYLPGLAVSLDWSGAVSGCIVGTTSTLWRNSVMRQVNFARALAGLPGTVTDDATLSAKAQAAALMMQANQALNHQPPTSWTCYSVVGAEAAGSSNLALGSALIGSARAIDLYLADEGVTSLGHRRWVLYPPQVVMGTGDTPQANALWVFGASANAGSGVSATSASLAPNGTAWPPNGFVPRPLVSNQMAWSYSLAEADFSQAVVTVRDGSGRTLAITQWIPDAGYGDNTLAFRPTSGDWAIGGTADLAFDVTVAGVRVGGVNRTYTWRTTVFTPS